MWFVSTLSIPSTKFMLQIPCPISRFSRRFIYESLESKYTELEKEKILKVMNESDFETLSRYNITKAKLPSVKQWKNSNGRLKTLSDVDAIDTFTEKNASKLFDSILSGPVEKEKNTKNKIKGQVLQPPLTAPTVKNCKSVLSVYVTVNSISWTLVNKATYEVTDWRYHSIDVAETKKLQITDILNIAWNVVHLLPTADIYVMKAEATTLRAAGSDPNNPKVLAVNLQKSQMIAMIVALINARDGMGLSNLDEDTRNKLNNKVYFLRPSLPYRLYGTLVGNEKVSTDQTVELLLRNTDEKKLSDFQISESLKTMFRSQKDLEKDMLGHCLLLCLTFMDLCIYKNDEKIAKLLQKDD